MKYQERKFRRIETPESDTKLTVSFERIAILKEVDMTESEANILNAGRAEMHGNAEFTLFLKESDPDPLPITEEVKKAGPGPLPEGAFGNIFNTSEGQKIEHMVSRKHKITIQKK